MFKTRVAAEQAGLDGEGEQDFDTQKCLEMQQQYLSSPLIKSPERAALKINTNAPEAYLFPGPPRPLPYGAVIEDEPIVSSNLAHSDPHNSTVNQTNILALPAIHTLATASEIVSTRLKENTNNIPSSDSCITHGRSSKDQVPLSDSRGNEVSLGAPRSSSHDGLPRPCQPQVSSSQPTNNTALRMSSQRSSLSATQENPSWAYERFRKTTEGASIVTQSTGHTYKEDDTGHVNFDFQADERYMINSGDSQIVISQDASYAPQRQVQTQETDGYNPETPAPQVNPFARKGSVMKAHELFGATQPSSIGQIASPTSTRPSPDLFRSLQTPAGPISSPLQRNRDYAHKSSPLQSDHDVLQIHRFQSLSPELAVTPEISRNAMSFETGLRSNALPEPSEYVSLKESQERRKLLNSSNGPIVLDESNESDDSDMDSGPRRRFLRKQKEQVIRQQLSTVELNRGSGSRFPSKDVEVPSTGRRRSLQAEYNAQCEGTDVRDTQPDDGIIADSQIELNVERDATQSQDLPPHNAAIAIDHVLEIDLASGPRITSVGSRSVRLDDTRIPETSPIPLRTMQEMAHLSSPMEDDTNSNLENVPGLTQDSNFKSIVRSSSLQGNPQSSLVAISSASGSNHAVVIARHPVHKESLAVEEGPAVANGPAQSSSEVSLVENERCCMTKGVSETTSDSGRATAIEVERPLISETTPVISDAVAAKDLANGVDRASASRNVDSGWQAGIAGPAPAPAAPSKSNPSRTAAIAKAKAKAAEELAFRVDERRQTKIDFRKQQIKTGTNYEPDESDEDEGVKKALADYRMELAALKHMPSRKRIVQQESSPDPLNGIMVSGPAQQPAEVSQHEITSIEGIKEHRTPVAKKRNLRSKDQLKGPSRELRRSEPFETPSRKSHPKKQYGSKGKAVPISQFQPGDPAQTTPGTRSSKHGSKFSGRFTTPQSSPDSPLSSVPTSIAEVPLQVKATTRAGKRHSAIATNNQPNSSAIISRTKKVKGSLFARMAFAVSYVHPERERDEIIRIISQQNGEILQDGFEKLFEAPIVSPGCRGIKTNHDELQKLSLSDAAKRTGFVALIADEHSRKAKYIQALALGLPCLSGRWILACAAKKTILDWSPYLLCAGQSALLGDALRSRTIPSYPASFASFAKTLDTRPRLFEGQSIIIVTGRGKSEEKRKAYIFLARVLGPVKLCLVPDLVQAKEKLVQAENDGEEWTLLYADGNEGAAEAIFKPACSGARKRKRVPKVEDDTPIPKRVRVIGDELVVQSLISGHLISEDGDAFAQ